MKDNRKKVDENLLALAREKAQRDKELLTLEIFIGIIISIIMLACIFIASFVDMKDWLRVALIIIGIIPFAIGISYAIRIEQIAGYYQCANCGHKHVPTFKAVFLAMHMGRTRHLRCPKCGEKTWQKKVL
jgi:DNA-directed RNA polymerase subunit RPC12/RpoP